MRSKKPRYADVRLAGIDDKACIALGWPTIRRELSLRAQTPMGRERCGALLPGDEPEEIERRLHRVEEARALRRLGEEPPIADAPDVRAALGRAAREGTLEPQELLQIARLLRAAGAARRFCLGERERAPLLAQLGESLSDLEPLAAELERAFDSAGAIADSASPILAELRERARGLHRAVKSRLEEMLADPSVSGMLRDAYFSVRGDRYVLPLRAEHRTHLPGIVHNASGSGQTLFVEPQELVELGNQLTIAEALVLEEEQRILHELSGAVGRRADQLLGDVDTLGALDEILACARLSDDLAAAAPALLDSSAERFDLRGMRHALLVLQAKAREAKDPSRRQPEIVANDVALPGQARALIVSGPNAGGKTVTVTAVGLCALLARAGMPLPAAEGSRMPLYRRVHTAIGDEGDIARDLSTFTAHLTALREILEAAGPGSLVVVDEIAADTDPREGAAIAAATLERLVEQGAQVLITTHLEELKALGLADPRFASASVGFDTATLSPTYRLRMGEIGASSAVEIARRVGLPEAVCARAREILGGGSSVLAAALGRLENERAALARERAAAEAQRAQLTAEREAARREREELEAERREVRAAARAELVEDIARKRGEVAALVAQLQAAPTMARATQTQRALAAAEAEEAREAAREDAPPQPAAPLRVGSRVRHAQFGTEGVVIEIDGGDAVVQMGVLRSKVRLEDLVGISRGASKKRERAASTPGFRRTAAERLERAGAVRAAPVSVSAAIIDLRGLRVEEALRRLEEELDRHLREGAEEVQVLHGHGTGALKSAVRERLARSPYVSRARPGEAHEGGDSVTVASLRG